MPTDIVTLFLIGLVIVAVVAFLVKSFIKVVIIAIVIYVLFHLGFIWGVDDLNSKLHLDKFFNPDVHEQIQSEYENFGEKREEYSVVDTEEIKRVVDDTLQKAWNGAEEKINSVDKEALLEELKQKLESYNSEDVKKVLEEKKEELSNANLTEEDLNQVSQN